MAELKPKDLRRALKSWDNPAKLGVHPIAGWELTESQRIREGFAETAAGRGLALRAVLRAAIESLAPEESEPAPQERRWRPYLILRSRYIDGFSPDYIAEQLTIARSTYNHEQLRAEKVLLGRLLEWAEKGAADPAKDISTAMGFSPSPFMAPQRRPKGLVGRDDLLQELIAALTSGTDERRIALHGLPGVGKTALAIELAHDPEIQSAYPDGVLWIGLGQAPDRAVALNLLAGALGLHPETFAALNKYEDRARAIHSAIGSKRMLLVLDDVWQAQDALALSLGGPHCATVLTSRSPGLVHDLPGFETCEITELSVENSLDLLRQFAPSVVRVRTDLLADAIHQIGGIPLALVLVGGYLRREAYAGQSRRLTEALSRLREIETWGEMSGEVSPLDQRPGLNLDQAPSLFGIIALSDGVLEDGASEMLRTLGYFPPKPATFRESILLSASGGSGGDLDALVDAGLVESAGGERYRVHGAIVQYARARAVDETIVRRVVRAVLDDLDARSEFPQDYALDVPLIRSTLKQALWEGMIPDWVEIANHYFNYLARTGLFGEAIEMLRPALEQVEQHADLAERFSIRRDLGTAYQRSAQYPAAANQYEQALGLAREANEPDSICAALQGLGAVAYSQGDLDQAEAYYSEGFEQALAGGLLARQAGLLSNLGTLAVSRNDFDAAQGYFERGLACARESGDRGLTGMLLSNLGTTHARRGNYVAAEEVFRRGLSLARERWDRGAQVAVLTNLGALAHEQGQVEQARGYLEEALELARQVDDPARVCQLLANLGALATAAGDFERSEALLKEGLALSEGIGHREHQILLSINLAEMHKMRGEQELAMGLLRDALERAEKIQHTRYQQLIREMLA